MSAAAESDIDVMVAGNVDNSKNIFASWPRAVRSSVVSKLVRQPEADKFLPLPTFLIPNLYQEHSATVDGKAKDYIPRFYEWA